MEEGRYDALLNALSNLSNLTRSSACMIVDERGLLVSEHITSDMDKNAMAVMCSLLNGTSSRFIGTLNLKKLNSVVVNTPKGVFLIKEIIIPNLNRKFTLSMFIEKNHFKEKIKPRKRRRGFRDFLLRLFRAQKGNIESSNKELLKKVDIVIDRIQRIFNQ